uniref:TauD/TfdA-like domain-containing protein n=1 Tax=Magnetococcus massalia (strain MO-1) TaxID=451514 RepID=A0A1S7LMP4_MAGMO|nr:conserved protein of unknown function [Candidatus Magnetococcus massalia]
MLLIPETSPFHPDNDAAYASWRSAKLANYPAALTEIVVEVEDPYNLSVAEKAAIAQGCERTNMAIYRLKSGDFADPTLPMAILRQVMPTLRVDRNAGADDDGVSALTLRDDPPFKHYIPYKAEAIQWHTDGYYNAPDKLIRAMVLHCGRQSPDGGENQLMDHEMAYIRLRDENPDHIRGLMHPEAMSIPPRTDRQGEVIRPERVGPVFSVDEAGNLHMRYTARTVSIGWRDDALTKGAVAAIEKLLKSADDPWIYQTRMQPGDGLICNNVLHTRTGFEPAEDPAENRLMFRIRCLDRV